MPRVRKHVGQPPVRLPVPVAPNSNGQLREWFAGKDSNSLLVWRDLYELLEGQARSDNTRKAKASDLTLFLGYFREKVGSDHVDDWTKPVTTGFQRWLEATPVKRAGREGKRKATSVNRVFSTLRHFAGCGRAAGRSPRHPSFSSGTRTASIV
jgi:hypothetical protein